MEGWVVVWGEGEGTVAGGVHPGRRGRAEAAVTTEQPS
jgi:hypothetical protein